MDDEKRESQEQEAQGLKGTTEKWWDATRRTLSITAFRAGQYRRMVQKKIDLSSVHRKISAAHADLGKAIDEAREAGEPEILNRGDVQVLFQKLDELKHDAAVLEHEIEKTKAEEPPREEGEQEATAERKSQRLETEAEEPPATEEEPEERAKSEETKAEELPVEEEEREATAEEKAESEEKTGRAES